MSLHELLIRAITRHSVRFRDLCYLRDGGIQLICQKIQGYTELYKNVWNNFEKEKYIWEQRNVHMKSRNLDTAHPSGNFCLTYVFSALDKLSELGGILFSKTECDSEIVSFVKDMKQVYRYYLYDVCKYNPDDMLNLTTSYFVQDTRLDSIDGYLTFCVFDYVGIHDFLPLNQASENPTIPNSISCSYHPDMSLTTEFLNDPEEQKEIIDLVGQVALDKSLSILKYYNTPVHNNTQTKYTEECIFTFGDSISEEQCLQQEKHYDAGITRTQRKIHRCMNNVNILQKRLTDIRSINTDELMYLQNMIEYNIKQTNICLKKCNLEEVYDMYGI